MPITDGLTPSEISVRSHDIAVCLEQTTVDEFEILHRLGMAVRLALHLRGVQAVKYDIIKKVAVYLLDIPTTAVASVVELLAEAEFVQLVKEGKSIKTIIPQVPYFDDLFTGLGDVASTYGFSEPEELTLALIKRLSASPIIVDHAYSLGAEKKLVDRVIRIGTQGSFIVSRRARGRDVLLSPAYFAENKDAYADLVASNTSGRIKKVLDLLGKNQGWPLSEILNHRELGGTHLDDPDIAVFQKLAGDGFIPPPAITTTHAGENFFLFGPRPGPPRIPAFKKPIYEAAMAMVAAVRQGQLLFDKYRIHSPRALLSALEDRGYIKANTEAWEQYRKLVTLRVGKLVRSGSWYRFELIDNPENKEAIRLAKVMVSGEQPEVAPSEDIVLALRQGEEYVDSLIGRKRFVKLDRLALDDESKNAIDDFLLRGQ
jgi:hypothetical protein